MRKLKQSEVIVVKAAILSKRQEGRCALCRMELKPAGACLDHNHSTGLVRGVLCRNCNGIEGKIKNLVVRARRGMEFEDYLGQVIKYWLHHREDRTGLLYPTHLNEDEKRVKRNAKARKKRAAAKKGT